MAASAETRYYHGSVSGAPGSNVIGLVVRHKRADNDIQDSNNPIPKPASGENLGWRKNCKMNWPSTPAGSISNLRAFVQGVVPTGITYYLIYNLGYGVATQPDENGVPGFTDTAPNKATNSYVNFTSSTPLTLNPNIVLSNPNVGEGTQGMLMTQLGVLSTFPGGPGPINPFTLTYRYAET